MRGLLQGGVRSAARHKEQVCAWSSMPYHPLTHAPAGCAVVRQANPAPRPIAAGSLALQVGRVDEDLGGGPVAKVRVVKLLLQRLEGGAAGPGGACVLIGALHGRQAEGGGGRGG